MNFRPLIVAAVSGILLGMVSACGGDRTNESKASPPSSPSTAPASSGAMGGEKMSCSAAMMDGGKMSSGGGK